MAMSWFERRQQAAKLEAEAEPAVVSVLDTAPEPRELQPFTSAPTRRILRLQLAVRHSAVGCELELD